VIVPIPIGAKEAEILSTLDYCEVTTIITNTANQPPLMEYLKNYPRGLWILNIDDNTAISIGEVQDLPTNPRESGEPTEDDTAL